MRLPFWRKGNSPTPPPSGPDPIDHPAIAAMSLREIADLPMWTARDAKVELSPPEPASKRARCEVD